MTRRLLLSYLTVTVFVLLVLEIPLGLFVADREREQLVADVERDAMVLGSIYEDALDQSAAYGLEPAYDYAEDTGTRVVVVNADGVSIIDTGAAAYQDFTNRPEIREALTGRRAAGTRSSATLGGDLLYVAVPVASGGVVHGAVRITYPTSAVDARIARFWWALAGVGVIVLASIAAVGLVVARSVVEPIRRLDSAAREIATGDLSTRIDSGDAPGELRRLVDGFNEMAERLDELIERHRRFVADASHQLRTPLTALRLRLETLEDRIEPDGKAGLEAALDETERLGELVDQLLHLARLEGRELPVDAIDLAAAVRERADVWEAVAAEHRARIIVDAPQTAVLAAVVTGGFEQIIDNYLSNAMRVTPTDGAVTIRVRPGDDWHEVHVIDEGPGVDPDTARTAFERFWTGDRSRTGLGLAIVARLAEASHGSAELLPADSGGVDAVVRLPVADSAGDTRAG